MKTKWKFINKSVQGASHIRNNAPCQDYSLCLAGEKGDLPMLLSVSDGHGGKRYVRSAQGAVFACEAAISVAGEYVLDVFLKADANLIRQITETRLKTDIVKKWRMAVIEHEALNPFSKEELELLGVTREQYGEASAEKDLFKKECIFSAYGATLLIAVIIDQAIICLQIGDGDILFYHKNKSGGVYSPIIKDEELLGNETTSLCSLKAPFYMRHSVTYLYDKANIPDLVMLATDGYSNSFSDASGYLSVAKDYYELLKKEGCGFVSKNIENWLTETSSGGSGDDISIVLAYRA